MMKEVQRDVWMNSGLSWRELIPIIQAAGFIVEIIPWQDTRIPPEKNPPAYLTISSNAPDDQRAIVEQITSQAHATGIRTIVEIGARNNRSPQEIAAHNPGSLVFAFDIDPEFTPMRFALGNAASDVAWSPDSYAIFSSLDATTITDNTTFDEIYIIHPSLKNQLNLVTDAVDHLNADGELILIPDYVTLEGVGLDIVAKIQAHLGDAFIVEGKMLLMNELTSQYGLNAYAPYFDGAVSSQGFPRQNTSEYEYVTQVVITIRRAIGSTQ